MDERPRDNSEHSDRWNEDLAARVIAWLIGDELDAAERARLEAWSKTPAGLTNVTRVRELLTGVDAAPTHERLFEVDAGRRRALAALAPGRADSASPWRTLTDRVAELLFDSFAQPALAGFRGALSDRVLRYATEGTAVELRIATVEPSIDGASGDGYWLQGTVTPAGQWSVRVWSALSGDAERNTQCDDSGYFEVRLPAGRYDLSIGTERPAHVRDLRIGIEED